MHSRIVVILMVLTVGWAMMIARGAYLQLVPDGRLQALQKRQFETVVTLNVRRGDIVDRNGHELAVSMMSYSLFADPKIMDDAQKVAQILAKTLKMPYQEIAEKLKNKTRRFIWIQRHLSKNTRDFIAAKKIRGLGFIEESKRIYPNESLLSQVLGFVGDEEQGLEGLELAYDDHLQAVSKKVNVRKDARGRPLIVNGQLFNQAPDGSNVQLTIDRELQFILEQELGQALQEHEAESAVGVVLDAQTSEVLAMASAPSFDANRPLHASSYRRRNRAITDTFEPGSTIKTIVLAGALTHQLVNPNSKIDCEGGVLKIGSRTIREADAHHKFDHLKVSEILAYSSNVGMSKIAMRMGSEKVLSILEKFGFGGKSGVDLPGEAKGIMQSLPWRPHLLANVSFGHGMTATPLQIANAYAAIANGGILNRPTIVRSILDPETGEKTELNRGAGHRIISRKVAEEMRKMLIGVTAPGGTGVAAQVPGFIVAGKTGTAQKVNPNGRGYLPGAYISSFAGFVPAKDPRFVIYVAIDHPRKDYYGSTVAAPVFSRVANFAVRRAVLAPDTTLASTGYFQSDINKNTRVEKAKTEEFSGKVVFAPEVSRASMGVAGSVPVSAPSTRSKGDVLPDQPKSSLQAQVQSELNSSEAPGAGKLEVKGIVPDFRGLSLREILTRVNGSQIDVRFYGEGFVTRTVPEMGSRLGSKNELRVYLAPDRP